MASTHERKIGPMMAAPRCGAKTRSGKPCEAPATKGRKRCRMHGGAAGSGAPKGNANALKHGLYTAEAKGLRKHVASLLREGHKTLREFH